MHVLVTGGGGFLGRYIVDQLLARGARVRSFGRGEYPQLSARGVEIVRGDIRDRAAVSRACRGMECVYHVAALPGIAVRRRAYEEINCDGTENVLSGCREWGVKCLVYTSSPSVVFAGRDQSGIDESAPYDFGWMERNRAWYSLSKARAEMSVLAASCETLRTCALRPHLIWGPGDSHLVPRLIARARAGRLWKIGDGTNLVDVSYVENVATAHLLAADALMDGKSSVVGKPYFISQGEPVNCWDWIDEILAFVDIPPVRRSMSVATAKRIGAVCESVYRLLQIGSEPPMTRFLATQLATSHYFDLSAARRDLDYTTQISLSDGMRRMGDWLRAGY